jgi:hypothetical protein
VLRAATIRTSYMRWSQAWMLLGSTILLNGTDSVGVPEARPQSAVPA